jgi:very-short-patch-repair endonuclease
VLTVDQLTGVGLSHDAVLHRVKRGWLRRVHRGVYLVGPLETPFSRAMAAVLAFGDGALLSHHSAAVLWGFRKPPVVPLHVTARRDVRSRDGVTAHRTRHLDPRDVTRRQGIPTTSPARTILDLAAHDDVERDVNEARALHLISIPSLNEQFSRYPRHPGTAALRKVLQGGPQLTRSEAERRALELIRRAGLPQPETNVRLRGHEVDVVWRQERLVAEIDGYAFHSMRSSFERDRRRDQRLIAAGYRVIRVTWRQLEEEPEAVVATLAAALQPSSMIAPIDTLRSWR